MLKSSKSSRSYLHLMEEVLPRVSIARVELKNCFSSTYPCQHFVDFYQHGEEKPVVNKALNKLFFASTIAENYAKFLNIWDFMHVYKHIDDRTREKYLSSKLEPLLSSENVDYVHINREKNTWSRTGKCTGFFGMTLYFKDRSFRWMELPDRDDIVRYFGLYLDLKSFNYPELAPYITQELRAMHTAREYAMKAFRDNQKAKRFGLETLPDNSSFSVEADQHSQTPLMLAIINNQKALVEQLLTDGADIHAQSLLGSTAVMFAAQQGNIEMLKFLVIKGASLEDKNLAGWSVFNYAVQANALLMVRWLLDEKGYKPSSIREINTALFLACSKEREQVNINLVTFLFQRFGSMAGNPREIADCAENPWFKIKYSRVMFSLVLWRALLPVQIAGNAIHKLQIAYEPQEWLKICFEALAEHACRSTLEQLDCRVTDRVDVHNLATFLGSSQHLEHLSFPNKGLTPEAAEELIDSLKNNSLCKLKSLSIHGSEIQIKGAISLADFLITNTTLETLDLQGNNLDSASLSTIFGSIVRKPWQLKSLIISGSKVDIKSTFILAKFLSHQDCRLETLSLNGISGLKENLQIIFEALHNNQSLKILDFPNCVFDSQSIINLIRRNKTLTYISLGKISNTHDATLIINNLLFSSVLQYLEFTVTTSDELVRKDFINRARRLPGGAVECKGGSSVSVIFGVETRSLCFTINQEKLQLIKSAKLLSDQVAPSSSISFFQPPAESPRLTLEPASHNHGPF